METLNTKGYNFYMTSADNWTVEGLYDSAVSGTFRQIVKAALHKGFELADIEEGVKMMLQMDHDSIHFGMYKQAIFSFNRKQAA